MIGRRLNTDRMFHIDSRNYLRVNADAVVIETLKQKRYLGCFSLAGLSLFTSMVHLLFVVAAAVVPFLTTKDLKQNVITQTVNVWAPDMKNIDIMFPEGRDIAEDIRLSDSCSPFIPNTIPFDTKTTTIFPKLLLVGEIDNRVSIGLFFFLSFAFQFATLVDWGGFIQNPAKASSWFGIPLYTGLSKGRVSKMHFIEYSFSATLMVLVMITQIGVTDLTAIISICTNTWACMMIGLLAEYILDAEESPALSDQTVLGFHLSFITHMLGWMPLVSVIFAMITPLSTYKTCLTGTANIPDAVLIFVGGEIVFFCSFGLVQFCSIANALKIRHTVNENNADSTTHEQNKKTLMITNACTAESYYVLLSLFAKTFLALTIYIGIYTQPG